jgi:hypothetical protein
MDEPTETNGAGPAPLSHFRIIVIMAAVAAAGSVLGYIYVEPKFGIGFGLGGILSFVNYYWMKYSLKAIFDEAEEGERPKLTGGKYVLRYVVFATVLGAVYLVDWHLMVPVIFGLTSFALAVVLEGIFRIIGSFGNRKGI